MEWQQKIFRLEKALQKSVGGRGGGQHQYHIVHLLWWPNMNINIQFRHTEPSSKVSTHFFLYLNLTANKLFLLKFFQACASLSWLADSPAVPLVIAIHNCLDSYIILFGDILIIASCWPSCSNGLMLTYHHFPLSNDSHNLNQQKLSRSLMQLSQPMWLYNWCIPHNSCNSSICAVLQ